MKTSDWINIKYELPTSNDGAFLIYYPSLEKDPNFIGHSIVISNPQFIRNKAKTGDISHWMYLPKPPKE